MRMKGRKPETLTTDTSEATPPKEVEVVTTAKTAQMIKSGKPIVVVHSGNENKRMPIKKSYVPPAIAPKRLAPKPTGDETVSKILKEEKSLNGDPLRSSPVKLSSADADKVKIAEGSDVTNANKVIVTNRSTAGTSSSASTSHSSVTVKKTRVKAPPKKFYVSSKEYSFTVVPKSPVVKPRAIAPKGVAGPPYTRENTETTCSEENSEASGQANVPVVPAVKFDENFAAKAQQSNMVTTQGSTDAPLHLVDANGKRFKVVVRTPSATHDLPISILSTNEKSTPVFVDSQGRKFNIAVGTKTPTLTSSTPLPLAAKPDGTAKQSLNTLHVIDTKTNTAIPISANNVFGTHQPNIIGGIQTMLLPKPLIPTRISSLESYTGDNFSVRLENMRCLDGRRSLLYHELSKDSEVIALSPYEKMTDVERAIELHEYETGTEHVYRKTCPNFNLDFDEAMVKMIEQGFRVKFYHVAHQVGGEKPKVFAIHRGDQTPFVLLGQAVLRCKHYHKHRKSKSQGFVRKMRTTVQADCEYTLTPYRAVFFPDFKAGEKGFKGVPGGYRVVKEELKRRILDPEKRKDLKVEVKCYLHIPDLDHHKGHPVGAENFKNLAVDKRVSDRIKSLVPQGFDSTKTIKPLLDQFVEDMILFGKIPRPPADSSRFYPSKRIISNYINAVKISMNEDNRDGSKRVSHSQMVRYPKGPASPSLDDSDPILGQLASIASQYENQYTKEMRKKISRMKYNCKVMIEQVKQSIASPRMMDLETIQQVMEHMKVVNGILKSPE